MTAELEDLVRSTLSGRAPLAVRPADWAALRARARRRTASGRATVVLGAAAVGGLALTAPWTAAPPVAVGPATNGQTVTPQPSDSAREATVVPEAAQAQAQAEAAMRMAAARQTERVGRPTWSTGPATDEQVARAIAELMTSDEVTDPDAQAEVIWSSAGADDDRQGPQVLVAVEQAHGWVVGMWNEFLDDTSLGDCQWNPPMAFGTAPSGDLTNRLVGVTLPCGDATTPDATQVFYSAPDAAARVVRVATEDPADTGIPVGTESDVDPSFGSYGYSAAPELRAYGPDGTLLDERTFQP